MSDETGEAADQGGEGADEVGGEQRPEWLRPNFKNTEEQAKAYPHAYGEMTAAQQRANEAEEALEALYAEVERQDQQGQQQQSASQEEDLLMQMWTSDDPRQQLAAVAAMAQAAQQQAAPPGNGEPDAASLVVPTRLAQDELRRRYGDFDEMLPEVREVLGAMPGLVAGAGVDDIERGMDAAYNIVKGRTAMTETDRQREQAARDEQMRQEKLAAQGLSSGAGRVAPPSEAQDEWAKIKSVKTGSFSELLREASQR